MSDELDGTDDPRYVALYQGVVTRRDDPKRIGRVKVRVPGLIEPESGWALPSGATGDGTGLYIVPKVDEDVWVWFHQGDPDELRYLPGNWGAPKGNPQSPSPVKDRSPDEAPDIAVLETKEWVLYFDDNKTTSEAVLRHKKSGDQIEFDGVQRGITIKGTTAVLIRSTGLVDIQGLAVSINGRPVKPGTDPI